MKKLLIISLIIIGVWIAILVNPNISDRIKRWISAIVIVSPIPPVP